MNLPNLTRCAVRFFPLPDQEDNNVLFSMSDFASQLGLKSLVLESHHVYVYSPSLDTGLQEPYLPRVGTTLQRPPFCFMKQLEKLAISCMRVDDGVIAQFAQLRSLRHLALRDVAFAAEQEGKARCGASNLPWHQERPSFSKRLVKALKQTQLETLSLRTVDWGNGRDFEFMIMLLGNMQLKHLYWCMDMTGGFRRFTAEAASDFLVESQNPKTFRLII